MFQGRWSQSSFRASLTYSKTENLKCSATRLPFPHPVTVSQGWLQMLYTVLLILAIWVLLSVIVAFPLAEMMHTGSGENPEGLVKDDDPASKGRRRSRKRSRTESRRADLPVVSSRKK